MSPSVGIVLLNYNASDFLLKCLESISTQDYKDFDVILVDNCSTDNSLRNSTSLCDQIGVKLIRNQRNVGYAKGVNIGIRYLLATNDYKYILILNPDTKIEKDFISKLVEIMDHDECIGIAQGLILTWDGKCIDNMGGLVSPFGYALSIGKYYPTSKIRFSRESFEIFYANGAGMFIRTSVLKKIGLFDEELWSYCEDLDLCWRTWIAGYKVVCIPQAIQYHVGSLSFGKRSHLSSYLIHRNSFIVVLKNMQINLLIRYFLPNLLLRAMIAIYLSICRRRSTQAWVLASYMRTLLSLEVFKKRAKVQSLRKLSCSVLFNKFKIKKLLPLIVDFYISKVEEKINKSC